MKTDLTVSKCWEIIAAVEGDDGLPRLDNMTREPRYKYAKGFLNCWEQVSPMVKSIFSYMAEFETFSPELKKTAKEALEKLRAIEGSDGTEELRALEGQ